MAVFENTLDDLVVYVLRNVVHEWWGGGKTTSAGSNATLKDTLLQQNDDYFQSINAWVHIRSGVYEGHDGKVSDFANTGNTVTFAPVAGGTIATDILYSVHVNYMWDEIVSAINLAIEQVARDALIPIVDEQSVITVAGQFEYELPSNLVYLHKVTIGESDDTFEDITAYPPDEWRIVRGGTLPLLRFGKFPLEQQYAGHYYGAYTADSDFTAGLKVRLEGSGRPAKLQDPLDVCYIDPIYVAYKAGQFLHLPRIRSGENDPDEHRVQMQLCQQIADIAQIRVVSQQLPPNSRRVAI